MRISSIGWFGNRNLFIRKQKPIDQKMDVILFKVHQVQRISLYWTTLAVHFCSGPLFFMSILKCALLFERV